MLIPDYRTLAWWYWLLSACLLTAGKTGWSAGLLCAIGLTVVQLTHFAIRERSLFAFPLQVRLGYLLLLLVALPQVMQWLYWLPLLGTWVRVLFDYCLMARMLSLLPRNREQRISVALLRQTFISAPVRGSILRRSAPHSIQ